METTRNTILLLIVVIGALFAGVTYVDDSLALGVIGIAAMLLLGWISREYVA